jgi:hypothetical protein
MSWYDAYLVKQAVMDPGNRMRQLTAQHDAQEASRRAARTLRRGPSMTPFGSGRVGRAIGTGLKWGVPAALIGGLGYGVTKGVQGLKSLLGEHNQQLNEAMP